MLISRSEAIAFGEKWYFTGKPCKRGHVSKRQVSNKGCAECQKSAFARWEAKNLASRAKAKRIARTASPEHFAGVSRKSRLANPGVNAKRCAARYAQNHADYIAANMQRKAALAKRTPPWADLSKIRAVYRAAQAKSLATGIQYHVDHEIPLRGKRVSGLHVENNLCLLPGSENISKGNRWE